jgi:FkbM family methyltransferase
MRTLRKWLYYGWSVSEIIFGVRNWPAMLSLLLRKDSVDDHQVRLRRPALKLDIRGAMDLWAVKETFLDAFYTRYGIEVQEGWTVVDIGAGVGDFTLLAAYHHPETRVFAYEPFPGSFKLLEKNITQNGLRHAVAYQQAVWSQAGKLLLDLSGGEPLQMTSHDRGQVESGKIIPVMAVTLMDILKSNQIERIDLLKLDCEGAEYAILMEAPQEALMRIDRIIMEAHDLDEARNHQVLYTFLDDAGFQVKWHANIVHGDIGYLFATRIE